MNMPPLPGPLLHPLEEREVRPSLFRVAARLLKSRLPPGLRERCSGEKFSGTVRWSVERAPASVEVRLFWFTTGVAPRQIGLVEKILITRPPAHDTQGFEFVLPAKPWRFQGRLAGLLWAVEAARAGALPDGDRAFRFPEVPEIGANPVHRHLKQVFRPVRTQNCVQLSHPLRLQRAAFVGKLGDLEGRQVLLLSRRPFDMFLAHRDIQGRKPPFLHPDERVLVGPRRHAAGRAKSVGRRRPAQRLRFGGGLV